MEKTLTDSILSVCKVLNKHSVQYLIVGGTAVALHGHYRTSINLSGIEMTKPDLDFWYNSTYNNYYALLNALEELGQEVSEFKQKSRLILKNPILDLNRKNSASTFYLN